MYQADVIEFLEKNPKQMLSRKEIMMGMNKFVSPDKLTKLVEYNFIKCEMVVRDVIKQNAQSQYVAKYHVRKYFIC